MYALSLYGVEMETKETAMTHHLGRGIHYIITHVRGRIQRKTLCMGPYAGVDYKEYLYSISSPYAHYRVDSNTFTMGNPIYEFGYSSHFL